MRLHVKMQSIIYKNGRSDRLPITLVFVNKFRSCPSLRYSVVENNCGHLNLGETFVLYFKRALLHYNLLSIAWCISFMSYLLFMVYMQILKPSEKKAKYQYLSLNTGQATRPSTPQRNPAKKK